MRHAARDFGRRIATAGEPARNAGIVRRDPQRGRGDPLPDRVDFLQPVHVRERKLVARIGAQPRRAVGQRLSPNARPGTPPCRAAAGDCSSAGDPRRRRGRDTVRAPADPPARPATPRTSPARRPVPRRECRSRRARRPCARVAGRSPAYSSATLPPRLWPAMSTRLVRRQRAHQAVEVGHVIGEPVAVVRPFAQAEAAPVGRQHVPIVGQRVDQELERRRYVHPAVQQDRACARPDRPTCARDSAGRARRRTATCEGFIGASSSGFRRGASFLLALRDAVLPAGAIVAVGAKRDGVLLLGAARGRAAIAEAQPIRRRKSLQVDRRRRRLDVGLGRRRRRGAGVDGVAPAPAAKPSRNRPARRAGRATAKRIKDIAEDSGWDFADAPCTNVQARERSRILAVQHHLRNDRSVLRPPAAAQRILGRRQHGPDRRRGGRGGARRHARARAHRSGQRVRAHQVLQGRARRRHQAHRRLRRLDHARLGARPSVSRDPARGLARRLPQAVRLAVARLSHQPASRPRRDAARVVRRRDRRPDRAVRRARRRRRPRAAAGQSRRARRARHANGRPGFRSATTSKCSAPVMPTTTRWSPRPSRSRASSRLPVVATHPMQFLAREDFRAHEARVCIAEGSILSDARRPRRFTPEQYFTTQAEMAAKFADLPEALANSVAIAQRCNLTISLGQNHLPEFPTPAGVTIDEHLRDEAIGGTRAAPGAALSRCRGARRASVPNTWRASTSRRKTIVQMGFAGYFLIVADFINWAKRNHVPVGPGRGSGAGSLVAYSLGITDLDPHALRAAVRALPQSGARVDARLRHRLLPERPRPRHRLRQERSTARTRCRRSRRSARWPRARRCATSAACSTCRTCSSTASRS